MPDLIDLDNIIVNPSNTGLNKDNSVNKSNLTTKTSSYGNKPIILRYLYDNSLEGNINKYNINRYHSKLAYGLYEDIWREIVSIKASTNKTVFNSHNDVKNFALNYLDNYIKVNKINISLSEYNEILSRLNNTDERLYNFVCAKQLENKVSLDVTSDRYNIISKKYINNYTNWIQDPFNKDFPGEVVIKNKLSLHDELNTLEDNYTHIMNSYSSLLDDYKSIQDKLKSYNESIPRSVDVDVSINETKLNSKEDSKVKVKT